MRVILVAWLAGMLVLCPQFCGTDVSDQAANHLDATHPDHGPCPTDADDCICQGAVPVDQIRVIDAVLIVQATLFASLIPPPLDVADRNNGDGSLLLMSRWGSPREVRAILQNYRC